MTGTAVVTGAAGGIGTAICHRLAQDAMTVIAVDLSAGLAKVVAALEENGRRAVPVQVDLTTEPGVAQVVDVVKQNLPLRLVVNNAGITRDARLINMSESDVGAVLDVNLGVPFRMLERLVPLMDGGAIVNIASRAYLGNFGQFNYSMSKGGLVGLTRALALSLAPRIRVNAIAPGLIGTEMAMAIPSDVLAAMVARIPMGRMGEPAEVAELVAFLGGDSASYITGQVVVIGGGRSLSG